MSRQPFIMDSDGITGPCNKYNRLEINQSIKIQIFYSLMHSIFLKHSCKTHIILLQMV